MPSVCFYFEVHQPYRLKPYGALQVGRDHDYFDEKLNAEVLRKVARKCYLPANEAMLRLIERTDGRFRVSYAVTGVVIEQMKLYAPEVLDSFVRLAKTGAVELVAETYYHSLAALYDKDEYRDQIDMEMKLIKSEFGQVPRVFRNTELIYNDEIGQFIADEGFDAMIIEGADDVLDWRSPNFVYRVADREMKLLAKNYKLSDDIAFRFSNQAWSDYPLTAEKFAAGSMAKAGPAMSSTCSWTTRPSASISGRRRESSISSNNCRTYSSRIRNGTSSRRARSSIATRRLGSFHANERSPGPMRLVTSAPGRVMPCSSGPSQRSIHWAAPFGGVIIPTYWRSGGACRLQTISTTWLRNPPSMRRCMTTSVLTRGLTTPSSTI